PPAAGAAACGAVWAGLVAAAAGAAAPPAAAAGLVGSAAAAGLVGSAGFAVGALVGAAVGADDPQAASAADAAASPIVPSSDRRVISLDMPSPSETGGG